LIRLPVSLAARFSSSRFAKLDFDIPANSSANFQSNLSANLRTNLSADPSSNPYADLSAYRRVSVLSVGQSRCSLQS
jgi:hypothetical protein